jgi:DeoR/GlpR family transcriptional regulator of sugar metabolism
LPCVAGEIKWIQAADILGVSARTIRRKLRSYQEFGIGGKITLYIISET